ncbi:MAG TPA: Hsp20/alpha crystallin family protein [Pirellulales bacterium]|nr:Hsp20/alpha crystallin family protein [Pirellulales bacterium]
MWRTSNGYNPVSTLRGEVDRLFGDFFGPAAATAGASGTRAFPALNIWEREGELYVEAELPGLKSDDLEISVVGQQLVIKGRRADFEPEEGVAFHRRERGVGEFVRAVDLPVDVDGDRVEAKLSDGVLLITLPKAEAAKPRKIQVKS